MPQLTEQYFTERFRAMTTQDLLEHAATRELTDKAKKAIGVILGERGIQGHALEIQWNDALKDRLRRGGVTNQCDFCGRGIALSRVEDGGQGFCGERCLKEARLLEASIDLAPDLIVEHAVHLQHSPCPVCKRRTSLVEMRPHYQIISAVWFVHRATLRELCCRSCGARNNVVSAFVCLLAGWWSLYGLFETPVKIFRNIATAWRADANGKPSVALIYRARLDLAEKLLATGVLGVGPEQSSQGPR